MAETKEISTPPPPLAPTKPAVGEIVLVRTGSTQSVPAIVNNDFPGQNMPDTLGLTVFLSTPYETAVPIRLIPDAQRETKDTPLDSLVSEYYRWWRPKGDKGRDLEKELAESR